MHAPPDSPNSMASTRVSDDDDVIVELPIVVRKKRARMTVEEARDKHVRYILCGKKHELLMSCELNIKSKCQVDLT